MMRHGIKRLIGGAVAIATLLTMAGCGGSSSSGPEGTLRIVRSESFDGWVLDSAAAYATYQTHPAVLEGLVRFAPDGQSVMPGLADRWEYDPKALTWTFHLRDNAKFSNGRPVTSADVAFSLKVWQQGPNFGLLYDRVKAVRTPDKQTAIFELKTPDSVLISLLSASVSGIMPADFGGVGKDAYYRKPIGAGPYKVEKWSHGGEIVLTPNKHFYDRKRPAFEKVVMDVVTDDNERSILFDSGDADIVEYIPQSTASQFDKDSLVVPPPSQISHLSMNVTREPFDDLNVRRAVAHGIDYKSMVDGPLKGFATLANGILAPNLAHWAPPSEEYFRTDLEKARAELADSAHPDGFSAEIIYDSGVATDAQLAQIIQHDLADLGIKIKLTGLETGAFLDRAFSVDADMVLWSYGAVSPDISDPLGWIAGTSWLFTGHDTGPLNKIYEEYVQAGSDAEREQLVTTFQDQALRDVPAVALAETQVVFAAADRVQGLKPAPWGGYYYDVLTED